jgi:hypothetical protein
MNTNQEVDTKSSEQSDAANTIRNLRDRAFDSSNEKLAVALGRPTEEIEAWAAGSETIDDDAVIKARGIALERGIEV